MKINCAIIDDEYLAREYLKDYVAKIPYLNLKGDFESPLLVMDAIKYGELDLLFLDIQMPEITGLEFIRALEKCPYVIITTAYKEFALEGYELNVVDYLLKPFPFARFVKATDKVLDLMSHTPGASSTKVENEKEGYIIVRADRKFYKINFEELIYMEGQKSYVSFYTKTERITALMTMKELEEVLPDNQFIRIHKSFIVSVVAIHSMDGNMLGVEHHKLPIGKSYKKLVENIFRKES